MEDSLSILTHLYHILWGISSALWFIGIFFFFYWWNFGFCFDLGGFALYIFPVALLVVYSLLGCYLLLFLSGFRC